MLNKYGPKPLSFVEIDGDMVLNKIWIRALPKMGPT